MATDGAFAAGAVGAGGAYSADVDDTVKVLPGGQLVLLVPVVVTVLMLPIL